MRAKPPIGYRLCTKKDPWSGDKGPRYLHWDTRLTRVFHHDDAAEYTCPHCHRTFCSGDWEIRQHWEPTDDPAVWVWVLIHSTLAGCSVLGYRLVPPDSPLIAEDYWLERGMAQERER